MSTQEPTLSDLENQEPQDELDEEQAETFVALSLETVRILLSLAAFDYKQSYATRPTAERVMLEDAIAEATTAYAKAGGQPVPPAFSKKNREVSPGAIYPDALPGEL